MSSVAPGDVEPRDYPKPGVFARGLNRAGVFEQAYMAPLFFLATVVTVFWVGLGNALGYYAMLDQPLAWNPAVASQLVIAQAALYTAALLTILGTHEMGHWIVARMHGVSTSLPIFIPMPVGIGTFGAVIAMKEVPPTRAALIRIGAAGPLAGGVVAMGVMAVAIYTCPLIALPGADSVDAGIVTVFGESIATYLMGWALSVNVPEGMTPLATPLFMAAWTGFLLTSINLFPVGQLDGGHVLYGLIGERANRWARPLALGVMAIAIPSTLGGLSLTYLVWGALLFRFVAWHPPVPHPEARLPNDARVIAAAAAILLVLTFMLSPMMVILE